MPAPLLRRLGLILLLTLPAPLVAAPAQWAPIRFQPEKGEAVDAEQTMVEVPESRTRPSGRKIQLPVIRFRSTADKPANPIIYLAGGPGGSGVQSAKQAWFPIFMALRAIGDVIVFDQRGTGMSIPSLQTGLRLDLPLDEPLDSPASIARLAEVARLGAEAIASKGIDLSSYNTVESADDVDAVREAIGATKVSLWGHSYGSHLALAVVRRHEKRIASVILGGVNGLDQRWRLPSDGDQLIRAIEVATARPGLAARLRIMLETLEKSPRSVVVNGKTVLVDRKSLEVVTILGAGDLAFVEKLPTLVDAMEKGEFTPIARLVLGLKQRSVGTAMRYAAHIASGVSPARADVIRRETDASLLRNAINFPFSEAAFTAAWNIRDLGDAFRKPFRSKLPALLMNGTLDGRTSVRDARDVASWFSRGTFVLIEGASHDFYDQSPEIAARMLAFLEGKRIQASSIRVGPGPAGAGSR